MENGWLMLILTILFIGLVNNETIGAEVQV